MAFQFKKFSVEDDRSTMKVNTDAVLLGAWACVKDAKAILDVGTGSGIMALMLAQRCHARIDAIDVDIESVAQANENFMQSPWKERLRAIHSSITDYAIDPQTNYEAIISNPPYFLNALQSAHEKKNLAKHTNLKSSGSFIMSVKKLLNPGGRFSVINPINESNHILDISLQEGLFCIRKTLVIPREGKKANRALMELCFEKQSTVEDELTVLDSEGNYTTSFQNLTQEFYLDL